MLAACFDASGSESNLDHVAVAGFVSSAKDWESFDSRWLARLAQDHIDYFHMREFAHSVGQFTKWKGNESRRRALFRDLITIIKSHVYRKFGCVVVNKSFQRLSTSLREEFHLNAYVLACRTCAADVSRWRAREFSSSSAVAFVFESGDIGKGKLIERFQEDGYPIPAFKPKKNRSTPSGTEYAFTPLQAADILAYELFVAIRESTKSQDSDWRERFGFKEFTSTPGEFGIYDIETIKDFEKNLSSYKRIIGH